LPDRQCTKIIKKRSLMGTRRGSGDWARFRLRIAVLSEKVIAEALRITLYQRVFLICRDTPYGSCKCFSVSTTKKSIVLINQLWSAALKTQQSGEQDMC
ncbi:Hypothetical predicted protein, partial [Pelobates cultripes]